MKGRLLLIRIENQSKIAPTLTTPSPTPWMKARAAQISNLVRIRAGFQKSRFWIRPGNGPIWCYRGSWNPLNPPGNQEVSAVVGDDPKWHSVLAGSTTSLRHQNGTTMKETPNRSHNSTLSAAEEDTGNTSGKTHIPGLAAKRFRGRPRHGTELGFERTRRTHPPSPRPGPARQPVPASSPSPTRPDPQSQSLFRSYGSNLPTSITYIILSTRGSSPWRPAADMGTNWRDSCTWPSPGFSRSEGKIRTPRQLRCFSRSKPYLPARGFHGTRTLMQKRKLFPDLPTASPGLFGLPRRTPLRGPDF
ncbi:hypothetical protein ABEB36_015639 [Hypothenemus hampei]|uniref:Uncharacterized protein n=1 Tax=Hypothenemus hampei TaxID=57062 RepID=A0ABD1DZ31_HYPHA